MSSTNKTTNYNLSQFVGTDVPSYLGDYNGDMSKIDKAIGDVANSQGSVEQSVVGLTAEVQGLTTQVSGVATSVQQLQTSVAQIDTAYKQADTALSQRITTNANNIQANTTAIESANTAIGNINTAIGTTDISGIGDGTIKGAISHINSNLTTSIELKSNRVNSMEVANSTPVILNQITLEKGTYILFGDAHFYVNNTGYRTICFRTESSGLDFADIAGTGVSVQAVQDAATSLNHFRVFTLETETTIYLYGYQSSGNNLNCMFSNINALKIN